VKTVLAFRVGPCGAALYRWILRRPGATAPRARKAFSYAKAKAADHLGVHRLERDRDPRAAPDGCPGRWSGNVLRRGRKRYGLVWMLGILAAQRVHPHVRGRRGALARPGQASRSTITIPVGTARRPAGPQPTHPQPFRRAGGSRVDGAIPGRGSCLSQNQRGRHPAAADDRPTAEGPAAYPSPCCAAMPTIPRPSSRRRGARLEGQPVGGDELSIQGRVEAAGSH